MSDYDVLLRHLNREIRARKEAEGISDTKVSELYQANLRLERLLARQKKISKKLKERTRDLEIQKAKTEKERHAKSALQKILESPIEYSITVLNLQGDIIMWNRGAEKLYGYRAEDVVHKINIRALHIPEDLNSGRVQQLLDTTYRKNTADGIFERIRKDKSHFTAAVNMSLLRNEVGAPIGYVVISKDITKQKRLEDKLIKSNQELEQFAYIASHDLKAPLRAIERLSSWIEEDCEATLDEKSKENLALLRKRVSRMSKLIDGILNYSRAGRIDLDIDFVNTRELLLDVVDGLNPSKQFTICYAENLPNFNTEKVQLSQVFSNLLSNSIKHHHRNTGLIEIGVQDLGEFYEFSVADDGPGIEPEYFEKIFQIFQTLQSKDVVDSTGIGLSIVKKIVEFQGGEVTLSSIKGKGTTFRFTWPKRPRNIEPAST